MGEPQPGEGEYVWAKVVADFFAECGIPTEAIPDLLKKCDVGSTSDGWREVANEWRLANGQGRIFPSQPAASTASEPLHKNPAEVLAFAIERQRLLATASDDSYSMLAIGRATVKDCLRSIRAMGEVPPHIPDTLPDIESVRKAIDQLVAWAKAMDTHAQQSRTAASGSGRTAHYSPFSPPTGAPKQGEANGGKLKKPKIRKKRSDLKADKSVAEAWNSGQYRTEADLAAALGKIEIEVHRARDRHRKRENAKERARKKPGQ